MVKGYYRLIDQLHCDGLTVAAILSGHRYQTLRRISEQDLVLLIQDGTDINFATHHGCAGLGLIGRNGQNHAGTLGLHLHSTDAVNGAGVSLGLIRVEFDAPDRRQEKNKPVRERKSGRWLRALQASADIAARFADTRLIAVADHEADFFDFYTTEHTGLDLLVRAKHNRRLGHGNGKLFDHIQTQSGQGKLTITVA